LKKIQPAFTNSLSETAAHVSLRCRSEGREGLVPSICGRSRRSRDPVHRITKERWKPIFGRASKGFTLVEIMVSLACMGIAFVALMGMHIAAVRTDTRNTRESDALSVASQLMEKQRAKKFDNLEDDCTCPGGCECPPVDGDFLGIEDIKCCVDPAPEAAHRRWRKDLTVRVEWDDRIGTAIGQQTMRKRSIELNSVVVSLK